MLSQFFELLRAGLWGCVADPTLFSGNETDWLELHKQAKRQTVIGIVFDGMQTLPEDLRPKRPLYMQWVAQVVRIERANEKLNDTISILFPAYSRKNIFPILLKGQGVAAMYPFPAHRQCGDIDIYVGKEGYKAANEEIVRLGGQRDGNKETVKHLSFYFRDVHIENHRVAATLINPSANRKLRKLIADYLPHNTDFFELNGYKIAIPPATFNTIYLFVHAFNHLLKGGIGLRQVCDWARLVSVCQPEIDKAFVKKFIASARLMPAAQSFAYIATKYIGLNEDVLPFELNGMKAERKGEILLADIVEKGNFGHHATKQLSIPEKYWPRKWYSFCLNVKRARELYRFAREEALWYPFFVARNEMAEQWKRLF